MKRATDTSITMAPRHGARPHHARSMRPVRMPAVSLEQEPNVVGQRHRHTSHSLIFLEGDSAHHVFQVVEGAVMLYKLLPDGRRQVVELLGAGDVFGLSPHPVYDCSAESLAESNVIIYDRAAIERVPTFFLKLCMRVNAQLCALHDHAMLLGRKSALERVASFVMRCVPGRGGYGCLGPRGKDDCATVQLGMTRQEIADYLGLTLETVSRAFSELRRRGVVSIEKQDMIRINDVCRVCRMTGMH